MNLRFWGRTALLFLLRSQRSTLVLSLMVISAVSSLIFLSSLAVGINDAMIQNSANLYSGHISGMNLPTQLKRDSLLVEGVANVLKRSIKSGVLSSKNRSESVKMVFIDPAEEKKNTAIWKNAAYGRYPNNGERAVFLGHLLMERLNIKSGDKVYFTVNPNSGPYELTVSGIYKTGIDLLDRDNVFCPVDVLPVSTDTWAAAVFLKEGIGPDSVLAVYQNTLKDAYRFKSWEELMPDLRQLIDLNYLSMALVMVLVFGVVSLGISCAFVIFILKNIREYGIMKAMGVTSFETAMLIFVEVIFMSLTACCIGVVLGLVAVFLVRITGIDLTAFTSHNRYFAVSGIIFPRLTPYSLWVPPALAFFFSLVAAIWPAILIARKKAVEILRIV